MIGLDFFGWLVVGYVVVFIVMIVGAVVGQQQLKIRNKEELEQDKFNEEMDKASK